MQLRNSTLLLTGATGGMGKVAAHALAAKGVRLLLTARHRAALEQLSAELPQGSVAKVISADIADDAQRQAVIDAALDCQIDGLINLSGINALARFDAQSTTALDQLLDINLRAPIHLARGLLPTLRSKGSGLIVNVGSTLGAIGHAGYAGYCASKFGLRGFSQALQREVVADGIHVLYLAPRTTATNMNSPAATRLNQLLGNKSDTPQWVVDQLIKAIEQQRTLVHLGWPERLFVKLNQLFPALVDHAMRRQAAVVERCLSNQELFLQGESP